MVSEEKMALLLAPYLSKAGEADVRVTVREASELYEPLMTYLDLLLRWNARTNLTAIRGADEIVQRHFGESLFAAGVLRLWLRDGDEVLDFGSGAGFPGLPLQLLMPKVKVVLAESQGKKAAFLHEVVRSLGLRSEVWAGRVETMPVGRRFGAVTMRAVDRMEKAAEVAKRRVAEGGMLMRVVAGVGQGSGERYPVPGSVDSWVVVERLS